MGREPKFPGFVAPAYRPLGLLTGRRSDGHNRVSLACSQRKSARDRRGLSRDCTIYRETMGRSGDRSSKSRASLRAARPEWLFRFCYWPGPLAPASGLLHSFRHLGFHGIQVEARAALHRREFKEGLEFLMTCWTKTKRQNWNWTRRVGACLHFVYLYSYRHDFRRTHDLCSHAPGGQIRVHAKRSNQAISLGLNPPCFAQAPLF